jgi:TetR/AcrR family transcriptional regulator, cholesterol catabolism regulator
MDTKQRILLKAHELFFKYGIRSVSMDDIAAQLGMSKKTLYQSYADKEELVAEVFSTVIEGNKCRCCTDRERAVDPIQEIFLAYDMVQEMFSNINPAVLYDLEKYHPNVFTKMHDFKYGFLYDMIKTNLEQGKEQELYRDDIDVEVLTKYRIESIMLPFNPVVFPNNKTQLIHIQWQLIEHFLYGLSTTKGRKLIEKYKTQRAKIKTNEKYA